MKLIPSNKVVQEEQFKENLKIEQCRKEFQENHPAIASIKPASENDGDSYKYIDSMGFGRHYTKTLNETQDAFLQRIRSGYKNHLRKTLFKEFEALACIESDIPEHYTVPQGHLGITYKKLQKAVESLENTPLDNSALTLYIDFKEISALLSNIPTDKWIYDKPINRSVIQNIDVLGRLVSICGMDAVAWCPKLANQAILVENNSVHIRYKAEAVCVKENDIDYHGDTTYRYHVSLACQLYKESLVFIKYIPSVSEKNKLKE